MCVQGDECVLMTVITGDALSLLRDLQDSQVVDLCMSVLRELFQEQVTSFAQCVISLMRRSCSLWSRLIRTLCF